LVAAGLFVASSADQMNPADRIVCIVRVLWNGARTREYTTAFIAAMDALVSPQNGVTVVSLRVLWGDVLDEFTRSA